MIDVISPNTGGVIGEWQPTDNKQIAFILKSLEDMPVLVTMREQRQAWLLRLADRLVEHRAHLAGVIRDEVGKTQSEANDEVDYAASFLHYAASVSGDFPDDMAIAERRVREVPVGPALLITPYNDPLAGITRKLAPAIAAGCPAVVKPSPLAQLSAEALFALIDYDEQQQFAYMISHDDHEVLRSLLTSPAFRILSFTGSTDVGLKVARLAAGSPKKAVLELGGNNPFFVLPGTDISACVTAAVSRKTRAAGQACSAQNRIYVVDELFESFREQFLEALNAVNFGSSDQAVSMGPLRTRKACERLSELVQTSRAYGDVHTLGKAVTGNVGDPFCFAPTVLESDRVLQDNEAFGPLVSISRIRDKREAIARAVREPQALVCYFFGDIEAHDLDELRFGSIGINTTGIQGADVPTGGFGSAGLGREGGIWGLREFMTTINERWVRAG